MMNRWLWSFSAVLLWAGAVGSGPLLAGEQPPAGQAAPAQPVQPPAGVAEEPGRTQRVPFLGTGTTEASAEQRAEAGLPEGVGLIVQHVLWGSPAAAAGLRPGDVLEKLNDQILVNDPQFRVLLRLARPGERIRLSFLRAGKPDAVTVQLGETEVPVGEVPAGALLQWLLRRAPVIEAVETAAGFSANYEDGEHVLVLSAGPQGRHLLARTRQGAVLFDGSINTPEQRSAVPEVLRAKLKQLETPPGPATLVEPRKPPETRKEADPTSGTAENKEKPDAH